MIVHGCRLIFVHIQKTGGEAIATALGQNVSPAEKHFFARELRDLYGEEAWASYFKFSVVRNPWDRLVSWWAAIDRQRPRFQGVRFNKFQDFVLKSAHTFEEFLEQCDEEIVDNDGRKWIYRNQLDYLTDASGRQIVDFVGRFELLQSDFNQVMQRVLGKSIPLPRVNASTHGIYTDYYTPALAEKVAQHYAADIEAFGYKFGG